MYTASASDFFRPDSFAFETKEGAKAGYTGILSNRGKVLESDAEALAYAFGECGIEPSGGRKAVDEEFRRMFLEWFYSGDWIRGTEEEQGRFFT